MKKVIVCFIAALCITSVAAGCGKKQEETKTETTEKSTKKEAEKEYQVIGNKTEDAYDILLTNSTGQDITGIAVKTSDKTEYPANMMKSGEVLKNNDTAEWYYTPEAVQNTDSSATDKAINILYNVQVTLADGNVLELSSLGFSDIKEKVELCLEDEVLFAKYVSAASESEVSTKEQEIGAKAQKAAEQAAAEQAAAEQAAAAAAQAAAEQAAAEAAQNAQSTADTYTESYVDNSYSDAGTTETPAEQAPEQSSESCLGGGVIINQ